MSETIAQRFVAAREKAAAAVRAGGNGIEVSRELSRDVDALVIEGAAEAVAGTSATRPARRIVRRVRRLSMLGSTGEAR